jgi:hypothetical protein
LGLPGVGHGSYLTIIATGDATTDMEPLLLGMFTIPKPRKIMERGTIITKKKEFIEQVKKAVGDISNAYTVSPIYLALVRGVQQLRAHGCGSGPDRIRCYLTVVTDGDETEDKVIRTAILGQDNFKPPESMLINNTDIMIRFCGLSDTTDRRTKLDAAGVARMQTVWRGLFTDPDISFEPYCSKTNSEE